MLGRGAVSHGPDAALLSTPSMAPAQKDRLVRLLTQSPCLPFVDKRVAIENHSDFLMRIERDAIRIGNRYLEGPVGMVLLRYAIEWHIWRRAAQGTRILTMCDLAAARVTSLFLSFFGKQDQETVYSGLPSEFVDTLQWIDTTTPVDSDDYRLAYLACLRSEDNAGDPLTPAQIETVAALAAPTETHFVQGGDSRLRVSEHSGLNVYGCLPFPRNNAFTFASSTATSVSSHAYAESEKKRQQLIQSCLESESLEPIDQFRIATRQRIARIFDVADTGCEVLISASGTDSQLHAVAAACGVLGKPLVSIVTAADETGSGTPLSATGKHFSNRTCLGGDVKKGDLVAGLPEINFRALHLRDSAGRLKSQQALDDAAWQTISDSIRHGYRVLLHAMDQSKLGCHAPSPDLLDRIQSTFGDSVQVIMDACQARIDNVDIRNYIDNGYIVLLTGSKFYTGPPFSGAALLPRGLVERIKTANTPLPVGLADYLPVSDQHLWMQSIPAPPIYNGIGAPLRWQAALAEIDRYREVPEALRRLGLDLFCQRAQRILGEATFIELLFDPADEQYIQPDRLGTELSCHRTILPFRVLHDKAYLDPAETRRVYELLNRDIADLIDGSADALRLAARCCHIGQPVTLTRGDDKASATLRISAGARIVSESWLSRDAGMFFKKVEEESSQIEFIVQKIGLILRNELHKSSRHSSS